MTFTEEYSIQNNSKNSKMSNLVIAGNFVGHKGNFSGKVVINTETGLIERVSRLEDRLSEDEYRELIPDYHFEFPNLIFPGFIDIHVHAREDESQKQSYKEDFFTASQAAINGGVVGFFDMPNNDPIPVTNLETWQRKKELVEKSLVDVVPYYAIMPGSVPFEINAPAKIYMGHSVGNIGFERDEDIEEVLSQYEGKFVAFHCESPNVMHEHESAATHEQKRPMRAEVEAIKQALRLIEKYDLEGHICHLSTAEGFKLIRQAKDRGVRVTSEVSPNHLYFTSKDRIDGFLQVNPPLRTKKNRRALMRAFSLGQIEYLATDHAPHSIEENEKGISGIPGLDTYGYFVTLLMHMGVDESIILKTCSYNPSLLASRFTGEKYGKIEEGYVGSLTVINTWNKTEITRDMLKTKCGWSPFEGLVFPGRIEATIVRGKVYSNFV